MPQMRLYFPQNYQFKESQKSVSNLFSLIQGLPGTEKPIQIVPLLYKHSKMNPIKKFLYVVQQMFLLMIFSTVI